MIDDLEVALLLRAYIRRTRYEARVLAREVVAALSETMRPADGSAASPAPGGGDAPPDATVPAGRLMAMMGVTV